ASVTSHTSHIALETAGDKSLTNKLLQDAGIPSPRGMNVRTAEDAVAAAKKIGFPVVTKPLSGNHGRGVSLDLGNEEQVRWGFAQSAKHGLPVVVEKYLKGHDYRVLVINNK